MVQEAVTGNTEYTRGGSFQVNTHGNLTTASGDLVQGWTMANGVLNTNLPTGNITVPVGALAPPLATTTMSTSLNLDAAAAAGRHVLHFGAGLRFARHGAHRDGDVHAERDAESVELFAERFRTRMYRRGRSRR